MVIKTSGYSGTPLAKKLGIKEGFIIKLVNHPAHYFDLFSDLPMDIKETKDSKKDFIHYFETQVKNLEPKIKMLRKELKPDGMIWVSWYKKSARMPTDMTEDVIRKVALKNGLVDVKVCAVDDQWSGLKLVIPIKLRIENY
jgi:hypothetical protein